MTPGRAQPAVDLWSRELRHAGVVAGFPAAVAVVVALLVWIVDQPRLLTPAGLPEGLRGLGVLSGAAGAALWVTSLVLMVRFPAFDRYFGGLERLYFTHHVTGTLAYLMLLAHPMLLVAAALVVDPAAAAAMASPWRQPVSIILGWIGLMGLMAMLFATFFSRLPYTLWKQIHAASGVAYIGALAHVAWLIPEPGAGRGAAIALLIAMTAGLVVLAVRYGLDRGSLQARRFRVEMAKRVSPTTLEVTLAPLPTEQSLTYVPGQFVFVAFDSGPGYAGCREYHPFTISSAPGAGDFRLMVKALGDCTTRMQQLEAGSLARVQGPYGGLFREADFTRPHLWLGGGIGITPFLAMAAALPAHAASVDLFYMARDTTEAFGLQTLRAYAAKKPNLRVFALLSNETPQQVQAAVETVSAPLAAREVYVCGPPGMLAATLAWLSQAGVPETQIHAERFDFR